MGWNTAVDGTGSGFTEATTVSADITVYAQWTAMSPGSHTVTFRLNDGTESVYAVKTVTPPATTITDFPTAPVRSGYTFASWNIAANGSGSGFTATTTVSADIIVYAQWNAYSYTVTFDNNGGDTEADPAIKTVASPETTIDTLPTQPARSGYNFSGWYAEPDGGGNEFTATTAVTGNITVYAKWSGETYTVTFRSGYGTNDTLYTKVVLYPATTIDALPAQPARNGYNFDNWHTEPDGGGNEFTATTAVTDNITVYAKWTEVPPASSTVAFKMNDGTVADWAEKTVSSGATIGQENFPTNPARAGYTFVSWNIAANGSGTGFTAATVISGNITVYAQWTAIIYTIVYNLNGGTNNATNPGTYTVESPAITLVAPNRMGGYTFDGWYDNAGFNGDTAITIPMGNMGDKAFYARWIGDTYTVTFMTNDGTEAVHETRTVTVPTTTVTNVPVGPTRNGYTFGGWNIQADGKGSIFTSSTLVNDNVRVYAQWIGNTYTVRFESNYATDDTETLYTREVTVPATTINGAVFPAVPVRSGYTFAEWNTASIGSGNNFTALTTVDADITVYARWTAIVYDITYYLNNGTNNAANLPSYTIESPAITLADPIRAGYAFGGWHDNAGFTGTAVATISAGSMGHKTFYAKWIPEFDITLNLGDAGDGVFSPDTFSISKPSENRTISVSGMGYTNPRWFVDGTLAGTGMNISISATNYNIGGHNLTLIITKNGISWSKEITFTVAN
jgi:uncharacterized repeat protein (TIGR02543 family)